VRNAATIANTATKPKVKNDPPKRALVVLRFGFLVPA
jgi:hypothetical protein